VIGPRKLILLIVALLVVAFCPSSLWANTVYISQNGGSFNGGTACNGQSTQSLSFLQNGNNWTAKNPTGNQVGPGTTVYLCGTLSGSVNSTFMTCYQSGTSTSPILIQADSTTNITSPAWGMVFSCGSTNYVTFDGDSKSGVIQNSDNGSPGSYGNQIGTVVFGVGSSSNIEIRNWTISNMYVHSSGSDTIPANPFPCGVCDSGASANILFHDNKIHDINWAYSAVGSGFQVYNNEFYNMDHAFGGGNPNASGSFHDNQCHDFSNWDTPSDSYHHDCLHLFSNGNTISHVDIYNNYCYGNMGGNYNACVYMEGDPGGSGIVNAKIYNNIAVTTNSTGPGSGCWGMGFNISNFAIYNNTCVIPSNSNYALWITGGTGVTVENNTFMCNGAQCMQVGPQYGNLTGLTIDYNDWYSTAGQAFCYGSGNQGSGEPCYGSFSSYKSASGQDAHGLGSNPQLSNDGSETSGSPTIAWGQNLTSLGITPLDSDTSAGNTRTPLSRPAGTCNSQGSSTCWDIGAYQYTGANKPNPPSGLSAIVN